MKIQYLFLLGAILLTSCSKEKEETEKLKNALVGKWELAHISCGICPPASAGVYLPGNGSTIEFFRNGKYIISSNGQNADSGKYNIVNSKECSRSGDPAIVRKSDSGSIVQFIELNDSTLYLGTPYCYADGQASSYRRIY